MKFKAVFFSSCYVLLVLASVSSNVQAESIQKAERWFEVEVILFKQLGNKNLIKEQFPDFIHTQNQANQANQSLASGKFFDLLMPYLQPDLSAIKQNIPQCTQNSEQDFILGKSSANWLEIETIPPYLGTMPDRIVDIEPRSTPDEINLTFDFQQEVLNSPLYSSDTLCVLSQADFDLILEPKQLRHFNIDGFDVSGLPSKLNAAGMHNSDGPYIIADDSLLLKDINQKLRWSKEFKPLLHFGWRQVGITKKKAIPVKLYAGEHLEYFYQQASNDYQAEFEEAQLAEQAQFELLAAIAQQDGDELVDDKLNNELKDRDQQVQNQAEHDYYAQIKQQKLTQLFEEITVIGDEDITSVVAELAQQTLTSLLKENKFDHDGTQQIDLRNPPSKPLQPWFLDGFFKVHLDHYLYISADFNLFNDVKLAQESIVDDDKIAEVKLINFSQNRRVITGEIHYFDHPYIGMIVQIRRFDPTKPADEAVTQAIK